MNIMLILGHPRSESFCHAIAETADATLRANCHAVRFHDLYAEGFDPLIAAEELVTRVSDDPLVEQHCAELSQAEGLIIVHPNWWGQPPAILKGWLDRVIRPGVAYDYVVGSGGTRTLVGLLRMPAAVIFNTADSPREQAQFGNTLDTLWRHHILGQFGVTHIEQIVFNGMRTSTAEVRAGWLEEVRNVVSRYFPAG